MYRQGLNAEHALCFAGHVHCGVQMPGHASACSNFRMPSPIQTARTGRHVASFPMEMSPGLHVRLHGRQMDEKIVILFITSASSGCIHPSQLAPSIHAQGVVFLSFFLSSQPRNARRPPTIYTGFRRTPSTFQWHPSISLRTASNMTTHSSHCVLQGLCVRQARIATGHINVPAYSVSRGGCFQPHRTLVGMFHCMITYKSCGLLGD